MALCIPIMESNDILDHYLIFGILLSSLEQLVGKPPLQRREHESFFKIQKTYR